jgi:hypothetical protein
MCAPSITPSLTRLCVRTSMSAEASWSHGLPRTQRWRSAHIRFTHNQLVTKNSSLTPGVHMTSVGTTTCQAGGYSGFNLALRPGRKIVQAWRALDWPPDHYSIAIFEFNAVDGATKLDFTQVGVPAHRYEGHCCGRAQTYWTPTKEILEQGRPVPRHGRTSKRIEAGNRSGIGFALGTQQVAPPLPVVCFTPAKRLSRRLWNCWCQRSICLTN